jgi:hypothetical protein
MNAPTALSTAVSDHRHRLLRACRERPRDRRAAEKGYERAASHVEHRFLLCQRLSVFTVG